MKTVNEVKPSYAKRYLPVVGAVALSTVAASVNAAVDITPITALITEAVTAAVAIGIGFLGFTAGMSIYKKLRGAA